MQVCNTYSPQSYPSQLHKTASMPSFQDATNLATVTQTEPADETHWRNAAKWILRLRKRINVSKGTIYLAVSYLWRLVRMGCTLTEDNCEKIAATLVLMSAKMNEIYPPKMSALISKCSRPFTKEDMAAAEGWVLASFNFDMSFNDITYSFLAQILGEPHKDKLEDAEKLLGLAVSEKSIMKFGEQVTALAIVYLIQPSLVRQWSCANLQKVKLAATKVYNLYMLNKSVRA